MLPLGAVVVDDGGAAIGMVGQGGQVYARAENQRGRLLVQWGTARKERCELPYDLAGVSRDQALIRLRGTCRAATTDSQPGERQMNRTLPLLPALALGVLLGFPPVARRLGYRVTR